jgi:3-oxoacyl-[acyl-carrier protein] reductase
VTEQRSGRLNDRVAIITGAGQGIGKGIAEVFARERAKVVVADLNPVTGMKTATEIAELYRTKTHFVAVDVTNQAATKALAAEVVDRFKRIDILCHNVGIYPPASIEETTEALWDRVLDTNLKSALFMVAAVLPAMRDQRYGRIVFTSSITGPVTGIANYSHYGASKAGILGFMRTAALEVAQHQVTVNAVLPGNILTPGMVLQGDEYMEAQRRRIPLGRLGNPQDVGHAMLFLASDEAEYITGQTIIVDGGQTLPEA